MVGGGRTAPPNAPEASRPTASAPSRPASDTPSTERATASDPFAGLPRLSPLPDDMELIVDPPAPQPNPVADEKPAGGYHGRRRAVDDDEPTGGRRRAPDDAPDDLFARIRRS